MVEKSKNQATPFDTMLQSGETLLWQSASRPPLLPPNMLRYVGGFIIFGIFFAASFFADDLSRINNPQKLNSLLIGIGVLVLFAIPVLLIIGGVAFARNFFKSRPVFAVTNYRLLVYVNKRKAACDLLDIPNIMKFESGGGRGTLNFGTVFPMFTDVANVNQVYQLIQEQQRKLQKRTGQGY
jgi:hypothetical protein